MKIVKNSDRYKDILSSKSALSKSDIEHYRIASSADQNNIEQKLVDDSFAADAMEGWSDLNFDTSLLKSSGELFPKQRFPWYIASCALVVGICSVLLFQYLSNDRNFKLLDISNNSTKSIALNTIIIEPSDVVLPDSIQNLTIVDITKQMNIQKIKDDFLQLDLPEIEFTKLSPIKPNENTIEKEIVTSKTIGKEIYFFDLKLIDYEEYRTNSVIKTEQLILTGIPANKENNRSEEMESDWGEVDIPYQDYLKKSIRQFDQLHYKKALTRFQTILATYPKDINANFYGGLCLFNFGQYNTAIAHFEQCLTSGYLNFDEEAEWMIANSYLNMGNSIEGVKLMTNIVRKSGYYSIQASEKIK